MSANFFDLICGYEFVRFVNGETVAGARIALLNVDVQKFDVDVEPGQVVENPRDIKVGGIFSGITYIDKLMKYSL